MTRSLLTGLLIGTLCASGCGGLALEHSLRETGRDWPQFGMNGARTAWSSQKLRPPLRAAWSQDIAGGVGSGSPVVIDSTVLVGTMRGELYALHTGTGKTLGWISLGEAIHGSPVVERFVAVVALANTPASLVSYDIYSGTVRWTHAYGDIECTPVKDEDRIYVGNLQGMVFAVSTFDGSERWRYSLPDNHALKGIRSSPALAEGTVLFGADDGALYALDSETGSLRWRTEAGAPVWAAPAVAGDRVIASTIEGTVLACELSSGAVLWRRAAGAPVYAGALIANAIAVVGTLGGRILALDLATGATRWETDAGGPVNAQMVAASTIGYVGTLTRELLAVDLTGGTIVWRYTLSGRIKSSAALANGQLFVATDDRELVAFREDHQ